MWLFWAAGLLGGSAAVFMWNANGERIYRTIGLLLIGISLTFVHLFRLSRRKFFNNLGADKIDKLGKYNSDRNRNKRYIVGVMLLMIPSIIFYAAKHYIDD
ncbi:MAG: hypothetical protein ACRETL_10095 [Gammaproteobacteria bacterium]